MKAIDYEAFRKKSILAMANAILLRDYDAARRIKEFIEVLEKEEKVEAEPVRKPEMSEADRKKCEEWCKDCEHIEMCKWYPFGGCDFRLLPKPEQSTIEPEVRHGRWIVHTTWNGMFGLIHSECSECKFDRNGDLSSWNFCPNCGRDMRVTGTNVDGKGGAGQ